MAIPSYQDFMLPLLTALSDGTERKSSEVDGLLADRLKLTPEDQATKLPSGVQSVWTNRTGWARTYLKKAGLISSPRRGIVTITDDGRKLLAEKPERIDWRLLLRYEAFRQFQAQSVPKSEDGATAATPTPEPEETPGESMERAYRALRHDLEDELLQKLKACSPSYFETIVVQLLVAMGYGGSLKDAGKAVGRSGDGGIDGIIKEDKLGLDVVYIQAKRWEGVVGRPEIQKFVGALAGQKAGKGVFITTSGFTKEAVDYAGGVQQKVILLDGPELSRLMFDNGQGVETKATFELKKIDNDFFEEE